jgi:hypothetical protein
LRTLAARNAETSDASSKASGSIMLRKTGASWRERKENPSWITTAAMSGFSIAAHNASSALPTITGS